MQDYFFINGKWETTQSSQEFPIIHPANEKLCALLPLATIEDTEKAIQAAKKAFPKWKETSKEERKQFVEKILHLYEKYQQEIGQAIALEMGAPLDFAQNSQAKAGLKNIQTFLKAFDQFSFTQNFQETSYAFSDTQNTSLHFSPIGVVGLITPWNWPIHQITLKVIPALLTGCTMVLKPSELAPLSAILFAKILEEAQLPPGVFNMIFGVGEKVGRYLSAHKDIAMISFTGSTKAGQDVSKTAAQTLKRVTLELGGKGANIICKDADPEAVRRGVAHCFNNSGQSCNAPTRMLVERDIYEKALEEAKQQAQQTQLGLSLKSGTHIGPVISKKQFDNIRALIQSGIEEGAKLLIGGPEQPENFPKGFFIKPTIFYDVAPHMRIFKEEIFGPVLSITPFDSIEEAIYLANDTDYGLTNYVQSQNLEKCHYIATQLQSGMVEINGNSLPQECFFGGVKYSGRAREGGIFGLEEFLETRALTL